MSLSGADRPTGIAILDRILDGSAPDSLREAAARGALPVPRGALLRVLVHLAEDPVDGIRDRARATIGAVPETELLEILADPATDPSVLDHYVLSPNAGVELIGTAMSNRSISLETLERIAATGAPSALDLLLTNQERLRKSPSIVDALATNPRLSADQRRRLLDFIEHFGATTAPGAPAAEPAPGVLGPELLGPVSEEELRSLLGQLGDLPFISLEVGEFLGEGGAIEGIEELAAEGPAFETVYKQILRMNPAQRIRAALKGGREARQILIRDTNRVVSSAVLRNARVTEEEIVSFAAQKSLAEEILRQIGSSRAWLSSYAIVLNLVRNPKTPQAISMNNVARLSTRDLTQIHRDRNAPEVIRRMAKKHIEMREAKPVKYKKH